MLFSDGRSYKVLSNAKQGMSARIFKVSGEGNPSSVSALRIPLSSSKAEYINRTLSAYPVLTQSGVRVPHLINSLSGEYILHEWIEYDCNLAEIFDEINKTYREEAISSFREFAKSTAYLSYIGDFKPTQLVYDKKKREWVLLDWTEAKTFNSTQAISKNVFDENGALFERLLSVQTVAQFKKSIQNERQNSMAEKKAFKSSYRENRYDCPDILRRTSRFE